MSMGPTPCVTENSGLTHSWVTGTKTLATTTFMHARSTSSVKVTIISRVSNDPTTSSVKMTIISSVNNGPTSKNEQCKKIIINLYMLLLASGPSSIAFEAILATISVIIVATIASVASAAVAIVCFFKKKRHTTKARTENNQRLDDQQDGAATMFDNFNQNLSMTSNVAYGCANDAEVHEVIYEEIDEVYYDDNDDEYI